VSLFTRANAKPQWIAGSGQYGDGAVSDFEMGVWRLSALREDCDRALRRAKRCRVFSHVAVLFELHFYSVGGSRLELRQNDAQQRTQCLSCLKLKQSGKAWCPFCPAAPSCA